MIETAHDLNFIKMRETRVRGGYVDTLASELHVVAEPSDAIHSSKASFSNF